MKSKPCPKCNHGERNHGAYCRDCTNVYAKERRKSFKEKTHIPAAQPGRGLSGEEKATYAKEYNKKWREAKGNEILRAEKRAYRHAIRAEGLAAYGGKCSCCGEEIQNFLTIEHLVARDPNILKHKQRGHNEWLRLKRMGWPKDDYTILCFNCNSAKGIYGECPHKSNLKDG
jgi:hypothetical protein